MAKRVAMRATPRLLQHLLPLRQHSSVDLQKCQQEHGDLVTVACLQHLA